MGPRKPQRGTVGRTGQQEGQHLRGLGKKEDSRERCSEQEEPASLRLIRLSVHPPSIRPSVHSLRHLSTYLPNSLPAQPPTHLSDVQQVPRPRGQPPTAGLGTERRPDGVCPPESKEQPGPRAESHLICCWKKAPDSAAPSLWSLTGREEPGTALGS